MKRNFLDPRALGDVSRIFKALGEPIRLRILQELQDAEKSVSELSASVGTSQPNLSKHLKTLAEAHILGRRQEGNSAYYSIRDPMVHQLCDLVCRGIQKRLGEQIKAYSAGASPTRRKRAS